MAKYKYALCCIIIVYLVSACIDQKSSPITVNGEAGKLAVYLAADQAIRVVLKPLSFPEEFPYTPALVEKDYGQPVIELVEMTGEHTAIAGELQVTVTPDPISLKIHRKDGSLVQELSFSEAGSLSFQIGDQPVLGLGEGGPRPQDNVNLDSVTVEYDRRGRYHSMQPRWQSDIYGSRNPVAALISPGNYGLFVATPWMEVDLTDSLKGKFIPWEPDSLARIPQAFSNQQETLAKGKPPADSLIKGMIDLFVFDAKDPLKLMQNMAEISGQAVMPPKWAMGYMQSHRTLENDRQLIEIVDTFRDKAIPLDAVIYLGTGFTPSGWNTEQPSFDFNPAVFKRDPKLVLDELHNRQVKVVVHMVPWDRDRLPYLHGSIPPEGNDAPAPGHIAAYWQEHIELMETGVDAWWPDEGDWFGLFERMKRHEMYYSGPINTYHKRPWSLHRNGHLGIARWGGWVWSGDTQSRWKALEGQIAVGLNHSISLSPFWGSDIGGFYPTKELDGELYIRWFQFGAFVPSFRSHGRTWWTRLPWGWGLPEMGPPESPTPPDPSALNNPAIEPIAKKYAELRYRLLPYNYTLAWQARKDGLPMIRPLWLHYPSDRKAMEIADQYLWGQDLLIAPVYTKGAKERTVYLPEGQWYDFWTGDRFGGDQNLQRDIDLETMPIYVRAGALVPLDPVRQFTDQSVDEPMELRIYGGADGDFSLYEDDGNSLDYLKGAYAITQFHWNEETRTLTIREVEKGFDAQKNPLISVRLLPDDIVQEVHFTGPSMEVVF